MFYNNYFKFYLFFSLKTIQRFFRYYIIPDKLAIKWKFKKRMGYKLKLNNPVNFNEKLQWLKLHNRNEKLSDLVDKYKVRKYLTEILGPESNKYLIPLVFHTKHVKNITPENLPNFPVIIKSNHDQGGFKIILNKNEVNWKEVQFFFLNRLKTNFFWPNREWPYKNVEKGIIVEKLINTDGQLPLDVKMHCFHGEVKLIQISGYDSSNVKRLAFFNANLIRLKEEIIDVFPPMEDIDIHKIIKPEMYEISSKISSSHKYIRIDMYSHQDLIYIGELTFFPTAGFITYFTNEFLVEIGSWLDLKENNL